MRISTAWSQQIGVNTMLTQQSKLSLTQMQLSTGKRILTAADDPAGASRAIDLNKSLADNEQFQSNINSAQQRLEMEDGLLQNATDVMYRIKELAIQGLNDTNSPNDRITIANEMDLLNGELLSLANTKNANGEYIFSGFKTDTPAFSKDASNNGVYVYNGDTNTRSIQIGLERQVTDGDPGINVFGTPTTSGTLPEAGAMTNVFEAIEQFTNDLRADAPNTNSLDDFDASLERIITAQSSVGVRLKALDSQNNLNQDLKISLKSVLSNTQDLDYSEAIARLNAQDLSLKAAQQAYAQVSQLSLLNYL